MPSLILSGIGPIDHNEQLLRAFEPLCGHAAIPLIASVMKRRVAQQTVDALDPVLERGAPAQVKRNG